MDKSRLPNFYKYSVSERLRLLYERQVISEDSYHTLMDGVATLDVNSADRMVENVVGVFGLPMGLGLNFVINDKPYIVPMVVEEPSIIAFNGSWGVSTKGIGDFFKPRRQFKKANILIEAAKILNKEVSQEEAEVLLENSQSKFWSDTNDIIEVYKEEPIFEGKFSNESYKARVYEAIEDFNNQNERNILKEWENIIFHLPYAYHGRRMITDKWIEWMEKNGDSELIYSEAGNPKSKIDKDWIKKVSKSSVYKKFIEQKIAPGEKASSEIGNMYTASIFMSLISSLVEASSNDNEFANKKIGFISYGSGSKAKIFEGTVQTNWKDKIERVKLFQNLDSRKKISIDIYEQLHKRKVSSNINNNQGIIKLKNIDNGEFTEGLRNYFKY